VRLTLDPIALELLAEAPAGDGPREISGLAVPWEQEARIKDRRVTFAADSVAIEIGSPLLLGHDDNQPVGVLTSSTSSRDGLRAVFAIDRTPAGDAAIVQARSGSRRGLSVGVDLEADGFETDPRDPDRIRVLAGRAAETSLVAMAAYPTAGVEQIAAHKQEESDVETTPKPPEPDQPEPDDDDDDDTQPAEPESRVQARRSRGLVIADRAEPSMRLGEYVQELVKAERGDRAARIRIEAALTRENVTTNPGVVPIAYVTQVIDSLGDARPLFDAMDHADMPAAGMTIRRPEITTRPDGGFLADDTAGAPTSAVAIGNHDVNVRQWAWGGAASVALVERSSPSYVEEVFRQAVKSYYKDVEADIAAGFTAAVGTATTIGGAVAEFLGAYRDYPNLIVCGGDAYGKLLDATGVMLLTSGSADAQGNASYAGMRVVASPDVAPGDAWITRSDFQEIRESSPIRLTVSDVESLSLEIGVTSFYARTPTRQTLGGVPGAVHIPAFVGPIGLAERSSGSSSRKS
jgi:HK97 family phage prohead protease